MDSKTLALYLGCECTEAGLSPMGNTLVEVAFDGYETSTVRTRQGSLLNIKTDKIKLLLRPLSSMTEEEALEYLRIKYNGPNKITVKKDDTGYGGFWFVFNLDFIPEEKFDRRKRFIMTAQIKDENDPEQFQYLLSKHFDLFGLIEKGEAIDSTVTPL